MKKVTPRLSQQSPSKSWGPFKPHFWKTCTEVQPCPPPPTTAAEKGGGGVQTTKSVAFGAKFRYFTDQNRQKGLHENEFLVFSNLEMNVTNSYTRKSRNGVVSLVRLFA